MVFSGWDLASLLYYTQLFFFSTYVVLDGLGLRQYTVTYLPSLAMALLDSHKPDFSGLAVTVYVGTQVDDLVYHVYSCYFGFF